MKWRRIGFLSTILDLSPFNANSALFLKQYSIPYCSAYKIYSLDIKLFFSVSKGIVLKDVRRGFKANWCVHTNSIPLIMSLSQSLCEVSKGHIERIENKHSCSYWNAGLIAKNNSNIQWPIKYHYLVKFSKKKNVFAYFYYALGYWAHFLTNLYTRVANIDTSKKRFPINLE